MPSVIAEGGIAQRFHFSLILNTLRDLLRPRRDLLIENLALRQQILVLQRTNPKPPFSLLDKAFWVILYRKWANWRRPLALVKPETVISWHRQSWRLWWRWKSRPKEVGRPRIPYEVIELIRRMSRENPTWGAPRIHGELMKLGHFVCESTVARYRIKPVECAGLFVQKFQSKTQRHLRRCRGPMVPPGGRIMLSRGGERGESGVPDGGLWGFD